MITKRLVFQGYSDDTFGEVVETGLDYDNCASGKPIVFEVVSGNGEDREGLLVIGQFCPAGAGGWLIGVAPHREVGDGENPIPAWTITIEPSGDCTPHTPAMIIEAPADAIVRCLTGSSKADDE